MFQHVWKRILEAIRNHLMLKYFKNAEIWKYLTKIILLICTHRIQLMVILYKAVVWCLYDSITEVLFIKTNMVIQLSKIIFNRWVLVSHTENSEIIETTCLQNWNCDMFSMYPSSIFIIKTFIKLYTHFWEKLDHQPSQDMLIINFFLI